VSEPAAASGRPTVWLARHGQTSDNLAGDVFQGFRDTPLNDTGRAQAQVLAERIVADPAMNVAAIRCSDLSRARETAAIVGAALRLEPTPDPRLREGNRGDWEGRRFSDVEAEQPERYAAWMRAGPEFRFPGGESLLEQQTRVLVVIAEVREQTPRSTLLVCHRGSIRVALCSEDPRGLYAFHAHDVDNAGVVAF
jgi:broad specificity phosphatase PhoE